MKSDAHFRRSRRVGGRVGWLLTLAALAPLRAGADPGFLSLSFSPQEPVAVGDAFTVTYRIFAYADQAEIDRFRFTVTWPTQAFSFMPGSFNLGTASGPDQQWLSKPDQESIFDGFVLANQSDAAGPGRVEIDVADIGLGPVEHGTLASDGFLISFRLRAEQVGPHLIRTLPHAGVEGDELLYGTSGVVLGVPQTPDAAKTVVANTRLSITRRNLDVTVSWSTSAAGYRLQGVPRLGGGEIWTDVDAAISTSNGFYSVTLPLSGNGHYFRLRASAPPAAEADRLPATTRSRSSL